MKKKNIYNTGKSFALLSFSGLKNSKSKSKGVFDKHKVDGIVTLVASLIVLFTSLWNPKISVIISFGFLILYSIFKIFIDKR